MKNRTYDSKSAVGEPIEVRFKYGQASYVYVGTVNSERGAVILHNLTPPTGGTSLSMTSVLLPGQFIPRKAVPGWQREMLLALGHTDIEEIR